MATRLKAYQISEWDGDPHSVGKGLGYQEGRTPQDAIRRYKKETGDTRHVIAERVKIDGFKITLEKIASSKK